MDVECGISYGNTRIAGSEVVTLIGSGNEGVKLEWQTTPKKVDDSEWRKYLPYCEQDIRVYLKFSEKLEEDMGCDIHGVMQAKVDGKWVTIQSTYDWERDYELFGFIAGVRSTFSLYVIEEPKGLPEDFETFEDFDGSCMHLIPSGIHYRKQYGEDNINMGDHSYSWQTFDTLFAHRDRYLLSLEKYKNENPRFANLYGDLSYFFNNLEDTMILHGDESKENYRMVFGFDN